MKLAASFVALLLAASIAAASLYFYPNTKKPALSLREACDIAEAMLKVRGDENRYHITEVNLYGDEKQSGGGGWNLRHYDSLSNVVNASVLFPETNCSLHYYPHDYSTKGGDREYKFHRSGTIVKPIP